MKVQRNAPCPCGSGEKYKKCCGQTGAQEIYRVSAEMKDENSVNPRPCGECAACCQGWLTTNALGHDIYLGHPCPHSDGYGCTIHAERPDEPCRAFFCAWAEAGSDLPHWMQPGQCGVIVLRQRMRWKNMPVDILVSAGNDPDDRLIQWFQKRCQILGVAFVYQQNEQWFGYGPQQFQLDMAAKISRGEALWDGSLIPGSGKSTI